MYRRDAFGKLVLADQPIFTQKKTALESKLMNKDIEFSFSDIEEASSPLLGNMLPTEISEQTKAMKPSIK